MADHTSAIREDGGDVMPGVTNEALARRYFEEVRNRGELGAVDEIFAPSFVLHIGGSPDVQGREGLRQSYAAYRSASPDLHFIVEDVLVAGDRVVVRWAACGTHRGPLMGVPATGRSLAITGIDILRVAKEKIVEGWINFDQLGLLRQISAAADTENGARLSPADLVATYFSVWNEPDAAKRARLLEQVWAPEGVIIQPRVGRLEGRAAVLDHIAGFSQRFPGGRVIQTSSVDEHNGCVRYTWRIVSRDGARSFDGVDVGQLDASGKFRQLIQFDDPLLTLS